MLEAKCIGIPSSDLMAGRPRGSCLSGSMMKEQFSHVKANISTIYIPTPYTHTKKIN